MRFGHSEIVSPQTIALFAGIAAAGAFAFQLSANARSHVQSKQTEQVVRVGPQALVSSGSVGRVAVSAPGSYALVTRGSSGSRVTLVRAADGATIFSGSLSQLKRLDLGRLAAGEAYTLRVERGSPVQATLVASV